MKLLIKLGGALLESEDVRKSLAAQITAQAKAGHQVVVVHGGGKRLSRYLQAQGFETEFRRGFRVTPPEILDAVLRVFAGSLNHQMVAEFQAAGAQAVGLSGIDSGLVVATQLDPDLGAVGKVERVNPALLDTLTLSGYVPTVACIAGGDDGQIFNVNADQFAAACGAGFAADRLIFLTDVAGVMDGDRKLIPRLTDAEALGLIDDGVASGGMEAKLSAAVSAVRNGAGEIQIAGGSEPDVVTRLLNDEALGTTLSAG